MEATGFFVGSLNSKRRASDGLLCLYEGSKSLGELVNIAVEAANSDIEDSSFICSTEDMGKTWGVIALTCSNDGLDNALSRVESALKSHGCLLRRCPGPDDGCEGFYEMAKEFALLKGRDTLAAQLTNSEERKIRGRL